MNEVLRGMLMNKLKAYLSAAIAAALIGAVGLASRATGQSPAPEPMLRPPVSETRPLTELELLRREIDILKARMSLLEEKQRAQEAARDAAADMSVITRPGKKGGTGAAADPYASLGQGGNQIPAGPYLASPGTQPTLPQPRVPTPQVPPPQPKPVQPGGEQSQRDVKPLSPPTGNFDVLKTPADTSKLDRVEWEFYLSLLGKAQEEFQSAKDEATRQRALDRMNKALEELRLRTQPTAPKPGGASLR
jgi:hypothetical protein